MLWKSHKINRVVHIEEVFSIFRTEFNKDHTFPGEAHNFWECLYVSKGEVCVSADGRVYILEENDIIFHEPLEFHKFTITSGQGAEVFIFSFSLSGSITSCFSQKVFRLYESQISILRELYAYAESKCADEKKSDFYKYLDAFDTHLLYSQTIANFITKFLLSLADDNMERAVLKESDTEEFSKAVDYMNSNIDKNILISDIAKHLNTSQSSVKRIFSKYTGLSVHRYFLKLKIKAATELLSTGTSVSETAEKLGFSSQGYFSGRYKKETGVNPSEFKQKSTGMTPEKQF